MTPRERLKQSPETLCNGAGIGKMETLVNRHDRCKSSLPFMKKPAVASPNSENLTISEALGQGYVVLLAFCQMARGLLLSLEGPELLKCCCIFTL